MPSRFRLVRANPGVPLLDGARIAWTVHRSAKGADGTRYLRPKIRFPKNPATAEVFSRLQSNELRDIIQSGTVLRSIRSGEIFKRPQKDRSFYPIENFFRITTPEGKTAGMIAWGRADERDRETLEKLDLPVGAIEIGSAVVRPQSRHKGAMTFAIQRLVSKLRAREKKVIYMQVNSGNESMKRAATQAGFSGHKRVLHIDPKKDFIVYTHP
ncbi:MAG: GNAT family N-acetyltransferase [Candidatus Diapherotrites archaeon]|nr:GNAT family N-acetyltransferase [Candidatus Diapherotrites archaeon]